MTDTAPATAASPAAAAQKQISRLAAVTACRDGGEAFRAGKSLDANPHGMGEVGDRFLAHWWAKGYRIARDHGGATE